jgi:lysophospholipase L1-like esterase
LIKRVLLSLLVALVALAGMVGVEIVLALKREYLPTEPALEIGGTFGPRDGEPLRFLVLGDSTAAGLGADDADGSYAAELSRKLGDDGYRVEMTGLGVSGARTADVLADQVPRAEKERPDLVFVGIGANDVTHLTNLSDVRASMSEIVTRLKATGAKVVIAGAPDMRAAAWQEPLRSLSGWRGRQVAGAIAEAGRAQGVPVVPLAELTYSAFAADPERNNSSDLFHPSAAGYAVWARAIYPYLQEALKGQV